MANEEQNKRAPWLTGERCIATEADCHANWSCGKDGLYFRCAFCGHKFEPFDGYRWLFTNNIAGYGGNPFICDDCYTTHDEAIEKWKKMCDEARTKFWWFTRIREI